MELARLDLLVVPEGERSRHDEDVPLERLDLRALPAVADVLHRQIVQTELLLQHSEVVLGRIDDVEPDARGVALEMLAHLGGVELGRLQDAVAKQVAGDHRPRA